MVTQMAGLDQSLIFRFLGQSDWVRNGQLRAGVQMILVDGSSALLPKLPRTEYSVLVIALCASLELQGRSEDWGADTHEER
jgi:hypothetical protein